MTKDQEGKPTINNEDEFGAAFAEAAAGAAQDTAPKQDATQEQGEAEEAPEPEATEAEAEAAQAGEDEGEPEPKGQEAETDPQQPQKPAKADRGEGGEEESVELWRQRYMSLQGKFNKLVAQTQQKQAPAKPAQGEQDTGTADPAHGLDEDDEALLAELDNELPVVGKAIRRLLDKQSQAILQKVEERVAPVAQTVQLTEEERHFAAIYEAHQDFDEIVSDPQLYEWVDGQPAYLQSAMRQVLTNGTAPEVIDLFTRFKEATGWGRGKEPAQQRQPQSDPILERRRKQLEDAGAVRSRASAVTTQKQVAADDFEAAFAEAVSRTDR